MSGVSVTSMRHITLTYTHFLESYSNHNYYAPNPNFNTCPHIQSLILHLAQSGKLSVLVSD